MKESLLQRCEAQVRNEEVMRKAGVFEYEIVHKLCAMMHVNAGREIDIERIKDCNRILKEKAGILSNFRGTLQRIVVVKMSLADDPDKYMDDVMDVYGQLKDGTKLPGEMVAMAATAIVENCPMDQRDRIVKNTKETYRKLKELHPFLIDEKALSLISLMIMAGKDPDQAVEEAEGIFQTMKKGYKISSSTAQSLAMVLSLSDKPVDLKVEKLFALYEALKAAKHETAKDKTMVVYSAFTDVDYDLAGTVTAIGEVEDWLKGKPGYGPLSIGMSERRMFAAMIVLEDLQKNNMVAISQSVSGAVIQTVVEELVLILVMLIITSIIISSTVVTSF